MNGLKVYEHVIYIKEYMPSTIVQYEQYILQMRFLSFKILALTHSLVKEEEEDFYKRLNL